jgi:hypothetical protein
VLKLKKNNNSGAKSLRIEISDFVLQLLSQIINLLLFFPPVQMQRSSRGLKTQSCLYTGCSQKSGRTDVHYLVLARNVCEEFELADENVGMTVQKVGGEHRSRDLTPPQQWL